MHMLPHLKIAGVNRPLNSVYNVQLLLATVACNALTTRIVQCINYPTTRYDSSIQHEKCCSLLKACFKSLRQS